MALARAGPSPRNRERRDGSRTRRGPLIPVESGSSAPARDPEPGDRPRGGTSSEGVSWRIVTRPRRRRASPWFSAAPARVRAPMRRRCSKTTPARTLRRDRRGAGFRDDGANRGPPRPARPGLAHRGGAARPDPDPRGGEPARLRAARRLPHPLARQPHGRRKRRRRGDRTPPRLPAPARKPHGSWSRTKSASASCRTTRRRAPFAITPGA